MISIRHSKDRGLTQTDWLKSFHTFSFADYHDPNFMSFGNLRVINEDFVQPGQGFGKHPHKNMEIITYVIEGSLEHKDSLGTGSIIKPGEIQRMSAGTGITHSEFNPSQTALLHLLQIWILPIENRLKPEYEQKTIPTVPNELVLIGSQNGRAGSITIHQKVELYVAHLAQQHAINHTLKTSHSGWLQLIKGKITLNEQQLSAGDGAAIVDEQKIQIKDLTDAEFLLFDLE